MVQILTEVVFPNLDLPDEVDFLKCLEVSGRLLKPLKLEDNQDGRDQQIPQAVDQPEHQHL